MKWIGQHIWDFISRFRSDVYLEAVESGTIASGGNLGLDSNNKIVKEADTGITDLHGAGVDGSANQILTDDGDGTVTSEANFTFDGNSLDLTSGNTTSNVFDITANTLTTGSFATFTHSDALTHDITNSGLFTITHTKTGVTGDGNTRGTVGQLITLTDNATNHANATLTKTGLSVAATNTNAQGTTLNKGIVVTTMGAANNIGISVASENISFKSVSVGDADDYFTIATGANGATTFTTLDDTGSNAFMLFQPDGMFYVNNQSTGDTTQFDTNGFTINNASTSGSIGLDVDNDDADQIAFRVTGTNTTANIVNVAGSSLTTGYMSSFTQIDLGTTNLTTPGSIFYYAKSGNTAAGHTKTAYMLHAKGLDVGTNESLSYTNMTAGKFETSFSNSSGYNTGTGVEIDVTGANLSNYGCTIKTTDDAGMDLKIMSSADTGDYFWITTTTHGSTKIGTVDDDAAAANLWLQIDGEITHESSGGINKWQATGNDDDYLKLEIGTHGDATFTTVDAAAAAANLDFVVDGEIKYHCADGTSKWYETGNTDDYLKLEIGANGDATFTTVDDAGVAADLSFTADGKITMTPANIEGIVFHLDADADVLNIVNIDAGTLDVDGAGITIDSTQNTIVTAGNDLTLRGADDVTVSSTSADGLVTISSDHTAGQAIHIDGDADAGSIVDIDAGILDIDVTGSSTINTTDLTITGKTLMNNRTLTVTAGSSAGEFDGDVVYTGTTTGMTAGAPYIYNELGRWELTNASAEATTKGLVAIALGAESDVNGMLLRGMVTSTAIAGTPDEGAELYLRATTGTITTVAPSGSGQFVRVIGYCIENSNNRIYFNPDNTYIEIA